MLDNHDSFTFNLAALLASYQGADITVARPADTKIASLGEFDKIVFSPGPGLPDEFPVMKEIMQVWHTKKSILGVCLGHQMIAGYFGASLANLRFVNHGWIKKIEITDPSCLLFHNVPNASEIGVYHSWYVDADSVPECLKITAYCNEGIIMALQHKELDIHTVQFHPESFITRYGKEMIHNWIKG